MRSRGFVGLALLVTAFTASAQQKVEGKDWVARSNAHAQVLLEATARFNPEEASFFGATTYDDQVLDLGPRWEQRSRAALSKAQAELEKRLAAEKDPNVRQDLRILVTTARDNLQGSTLNERYLLTWVDAPQVIFRGLQGLLQDEAPPARRAQALTRLRRYVGLAPGSKPLTALAMARFQESLSNPKRLGPVKGELEQALTNAPTYVKGLLSSAMVRQELDRYTFRAPGQAGSYFYGYTRLLELRAETELALGPRFDRLAFNNFLLDQGLLPPELLARAVREEFIPASKAKSP